jgi:hypothetical protein
MNKSIKVVSGDTGSPLQNFGLANFIQVYIDNNPYFRFGDKRHAILLEELLKEFDLNFERIEKWELKRDLPKPKGEDYCLVGEGQINDGYLIGEGDTEEINSSSDYWVIFPGNSDYGLFPSISHLNKVLQYFDRKIIFGSQEYQTEEQKGFLRMPDIEDIDREYY